MAWNVPAQVSASAMTPRVRPEHLAADPLDPPRHLGRRAARKGHQQDAARIGAVDDQMRDAVGQGIGLARPRAGDDQERRSRRLRPCRRRARPRAAVAG